MEALSGRSAEDEALHGHDVLIVAAHGFYCLELRLKLSLVILYSTVKLMIARYLYVCDCNYQEIGIQ